MKKKYLEGIILIIFSFLTFGVTGGRILFLLPLSTSSHKIFLSPLINALSENHEITVLTNEKSLPTWPTIGKNVKELVVISKEDYMKAYPDRFENIKTGNKRMSFPFHFLLDGCHKVIQSQAFRGIVRQNKFDLIVVDSFLSGCLSGFIYKMETPFISVTTMPAPSYISERVGNFLPPSIIPVLSYRDFRDNGEMGFAQRLANFVHFILARTYVNLVVLPSLEKVYKEYLGDHVPGILEIESKAEMIFMNSHFTMNFPRPLLPTVIEIGGLHCRNGTKLNHTALENFISTTASPHGFIYFSVGSLIDLNNAPEQFIHSLMNSFAQLKQRVVLQWKKPGNGINSTKNYIKIPKNVWIGDWFSQQDILAHKNIRLFISHGGLMSMQESVYHAVPVLGIPFGIDQDSNVHIAVLKGFALKLEPETVTDQTLTASIQKILDNPTFYENAQRISKLFRNRQVLPLQNAIYWTEYVMQSYMANNSHYFRSPARNLTYFQYYSYDIINFLMVILVGSIASLFYTVKLCLKIKYNRKITNVKKPIENMPGNQVNKKLN